MHTTHVSSSDRFAEQPALVKDSARAVRGSMGAAERTLEAIKAHLSPLVQYMDDPLVTEIMVNSPTCIFVEKSGQMLPLNVQFEASVLDRVISMMATNNAKASDVRVLDARMPGLRIAAARSPVAIHGPCMSIRKHSALKRGLDDLMLSGSFDPTVTIKPIKTPRPEPANVAAGREGLVQFLRWMVETRQTFAVTGSTSSGKTSLLNSILRSYPKERRLFTVEDTSELAVPVPNFVSLETNEGLGVDARVLTKLALRMRPDTILHGECRGREAFDLLDAYRTGHPGSGVSFHAESATVALYRLETMVRMSTEGESMPIAELRRQIAQTFQFVIHCENVAGSRMPVQVLELEGVNQVGDGASSTYAFKEVFLKKKEFAL
jgi:pilus assembly protein CpaF